MEALSAARPYFLGVKIKLLWIFEARSDDRFEIQMEFETKSIQTYETTNRLQTYFLEK